MNAENKGGNERNGVVVRVQRIILGMRGVWVEIRNLWGIKMAMQEIKMET